MKTVCLSCKSFTVGSWLADDLRIDIASMFVWTIRSTYESARPENVDGVR